MDLVHDPRLLSAITNAINLFQVALTVASVVWILSRVARLWTIPRPSLMKRLGVEIPSSPYVTIENLTQESVTLHWDLPERPTVARYQIYLDDDLRKKEKFDYRANVLVGECERRETTVDVVCLQPETFYAIAMFAVSSRGYKSAQRSVRFRTQKRSLHNKSESIHHHTGPSTNIPPHSNSSSHSSWTSREGVFAQLSEKIDRPRLQSHITLPRSKRPDARRQKSAPSGQRHSSQKYFASLRQMEAELNEVREETQEVAAQIKLAEDEHKGASTTLRSEVEVLREKRKEDESKRNSYRAEAKHLQDQKRVIELERAKVESDLQAKDDDLQKLQDDIGKWELEENDATKRMTYLDRERRDNEKRAGDAEASLESEITILISEITELDHSIETLEMESHRVEIQRNEQVEELKRGPLKEEVDNDRLSESEWQRVQDILTARFEAVYAQFIAAEKDFRLASDQLAAVQNELGASIPKKSKNRRRPKKTSKVSSPVNSYPLFGTRFVDDQEHRSSLENTIHSVSDPKNQLRLSSSDIVPVAAQLSPTVDRLLPSNLFAAEDVPNSMEMNGLTEPSSVELSDEHSPASSTHNSFSLLPRLPSRRVSQLANEVTPDTVVEGEKNKSPKETSISSLFDGPENVDETISRRLSTLFNFSRTAKKPEIPIPDKVSSTDSPNPILRHNSITSMGSQDPIGTRPRTYSHSSQQSYTSSLPSRTREVSKQFDAVFDPLGPSGLFGNVHGVATTSPAGRSPRPSSVASFDTGSRLPMPSSESAAHFGWPKLESENSSHSPLVNKWQDTPIRQALSLSNSFNSFKPQMRRKVAPAQQEVFSESTSSLVTSNESTENEDDGKLDGSASRVGADGSVSTDPSVESGTLDRESTRESIFTRSMKGLKLTRKDSATKFSILSSWKKDGGLFGGNKKERDSKESDDEDGVINENINET